MNESIYQISERYNNVLALLDDENVSQDDIATAIAEVMDDVSSKGETASCISENCSEQSTQQRLRKRRLMPISRHWKTAKNG